MLVISLILAQVSLAAPVPTACRESPEFALQELKSAAGDPDQRSLSGQCLARFYLDKPEVAQALLRVIENAREDLFLREDLIAGVAEATLRRKVKVEQELSRKLNEEDHSAVSRTLASAEGLLAVTHAVKSMEETLPVTRYEKDFFRVFSAIAMDDSNHVILRETAVNALEKISAKVVASGLYDERNIRLAQETLRTVAARADTGSFLTGAARAYERLADAGLPHFAPPAAGRMLSSTSEKNDQ